MSRPHRWTKETPILRDGPEVPGFQETRAPHGRGGVTTSPPPRSFTPEQIQAMSKRGVEMAQEGLVRPPRRNQPRAREWQIAEEMDLAGAPCACDETTACALHRALNGRRRHLRPGYERGGRDPTVEAKRVNDRRGKRPRE